MVFEIVGTTSVIFYKYLCEFSDYKQYYFKIIVIDNADFNSLKNYILPDNIALVRIPIYFHWLNPAEIM